MTECVLEHVDYMEALATGAMILFPIGIPAFDKRARGIACDEYCLITGPTKSGKTTLAQKIFKLACIAAKENPGLGKGAYYSGEVSPRTIGARAIFNTGYVSAHIERSGFTNIEDQENYMHATRRVLTDMGETATVVNACGMAIEEVLADMRQKWETGHRLFVLDYIGKFYSSRTFNNREREIAYMSGRLFDFSKRPGKPAAVICLAQLNDDGQVRDCRGLEHDCDMHLKIARVFKQEKGKEPVEVPTQRSLIVERGRSIEAGYSIPIYFEGCHYKFEECTP
jgi:replicative DNA helicase